MSYSFLPENKEVEYQRKTFLESLRLYGVPSKFIPLASSPTVTHDMYDDIETQNPGTYQEPIDVWVSFEENPTIKTLKNLGWYTKGDENIPILAHVPYMYEGVAFKPEKDDVLQIGLDDYNAKKFLIKDFRGMGHPHVIYWSCKLVKLDIDYEKKE